MQDSPRVSGIPAADRGENRAYGAYVTVMLAAIMMMSVADRNVMSVLLVPIQKDLGVSDTAMGALTGLSFTLVYATIALPMARIADRGVRRTIIAVALAFWSVMTALCGAATSYITLLLARMGVAAGEAAHWPAQMSLIGDQYAYKARGTVLGFVMVGAAVGTAFGAMLAGALADAYGWRTAFFVLAAPGIVLAVIFALTVKEPARGRFDGGDNAAVAQEPWGSVLRYLWSIRSVRFMLAANIFVQAAFATFLAWVPAFLMRTSGMSTKEMSFWFGLSVVPAMAGNALGGYASDRLARGGARRRLHFMAALLIAGIPLFLLILYAEDVRFRLAGLFAYAFVVGPVSAVLPAANMDIVRPRTRATTIAVVGFFTAILGSGLGPMLLGMLNDAYKPVLGEQAVRYTLIAVPLALLFAALAMLLASRGFEADVAAAQDGGGAGVDRGSGQQTHEAPSRR